MTFSEDFQKRKERMNLAIINRKEDIKQKEEEEKTKAFRSMEPEEYFNWLKEYEQAKGEY